MSPIVATPPSRTARLAVALSVALATGWTAYTFAAAHDWKVHVFAARAFLGGADAASAYAAVKVYWLLPYYYPMPAALPAMLVAGLPSAVSGAAFSGASSGLLTWGLTRDGWARLPALLGAPFMCAVYTAQWSPLITASALLWPAAAVAWPAKPTIALAAFAYLPDWRPVAAAAAVAALSLAIAPGWPAAWRAALTEGPMPHHVPVLAWHVGGPVVLLALLRWREAEARLLVALACVPSFAWFYDAVPLMLVARTRREAIWLAAASQLGFLAWLWTLPPGTNALVATSQHAVPFNVVGCYLPALAVILRRPRTGTPAASSEPTT